MMNILLQLWPGILTNRLKNLNNAIEANWKEVVGHPVNTKLVSKSKWLVWLGCFLAASVCGTNNLWNKSNMIGLVDLSKHMKKYQKVIVLFALICFILVISLFFSDSIKLKSISTSSFQIRPSSGRMSTIQSLLAFAVSTRTARELLRHAG